MIPLIIAIALVLGAGGTAITANSAVPGDALFGVDRAVEDIRLSLSGEGKKNELKIKFAGERVQEIEEIEDESDDDDSSDESKKKDDSSDDDVSDEKQRRVTIGIDAAIALLSSVSTSVEGEQAARLKLITDQLNSYLSEFSDEQEVDVKIKDNNEKTRVDFRSDDSRVRLEVKGGELRVKVDGDDHNSGWDDDDADEDNEDSDDDDEQKGDAAKSSLEIEADIFTNETVVKVELNDDETTFTTGARTRAEIVAAVLAKYPALTSSQIEAALEMETEDRSSSITDLIKSDDDDEDDDEDEDDRDEDKSGSSSGSSGSNNDKDDDD